jgi:hypothetical protein
MSEQGKEVWLQGTVRSHRRAPRDRGKPFLGAEIECIDGKRLVVDYRENSLFNVFADRQVVVSGEPVKPGPHTQHLIEHENLKHFRVSTLRFLEVSPDAEHVRVGNADGLCGRFERAASDIPGAVLSFTIEQGDTFVVANAPAGAILGGLVEVWAYLPFELPSSLPLPPHKYLWLVCPCSEAVTWDFRGPSGTGPLLQARR